MPSGFSSICCIFLIIRRCSNSLSHPLLSYSTYKNKLDSQFLYSVFYNSILLCSPFQCSFLFGFLMTAGTAVSDMGDEPTEELRYTHQEDEHATDTPGTHSSSSATRQRTDSSSLTFLERLSLIKLARHSLGICFLLVTVLLFTTSNFLSSVSLQHSDMPFEGMHYIDQSRLSSLIIHTLNLILSPTSTLPFLLSSSSYPFLSGYGPLMEELEELLRGQPTLPVILH